MTTFILDFETTGLNPYHQDIIDIGCKVLNENISFNSLVKPKSKRLLDEYISNLTGISNKMIVKEGIEYITAYQNFINFIIEHSKLNEPTYIHELVTKKYIGSNIIDSLQFKYIDTIPFAKRLLENRYKFSLNSLCKTYNIEQPDAHRAYPDVISLECLYNTLCIIYGKQVNNSITPELVYKYIHLLDYS